MFAEQNRSFQPRADVMVRQQTEICPGKQKTLGVVHASQQTLSVSVGELCATRVAAFPPPQWCQASPVSSNETPAAGIMSYEHVTAKFLPGHVDNTTVVAKCVSQGGREREGLMHIEKQME